MTDKYYREIVRCERIRIKDRIHFLINHDHGYYPLKSDEIDRQLWWLLLLGLIETWDMIK